MANYRIEDLEGVGKVLGGKLRSVGIKDTDSLLASCQTARQREELAASAEVSPKRLLKWANMADLYRIDSVGSELAELWRPPGWIPYRSWRNAMPRISRHAWRK